MYHSKAPQGNNQNNKGGQRSVYNYDLTTPQEYFANMEAQKNQQYQNMNNYQYDYSTSASSNGQGNSNAQQPVVPWHEQEGIEGKLIYRYEKSIPAVVERILEEMGFAEWDPQRHSEDQWNILWKSARPSLGDYKRAKPFQKYCHIPKTGQICTKGNLARLMKKMRQLYGQIYSFVPLTFILPNEYQQFIKHVNKDGNEDGRWICKPTDSSRGRGITIINKLQDLKYDHQSVLQRYIDNPLLIRGCKWDMRIYVAIPQMRPMKLYLFKEGLVRFSTERYDNSKLSNQFSHLTNSSINKYAHGAGQEGEKVYDNKWTLEQLKYHFSGGFDDAWTKIEKIIILTCINLCSMCPNNESCFEILGFDIMVDSQLKPWLLEVNSSPAMSMDGPADERVKPELLRDTLRLLNFQPYEDYVKESARGKNTKESLISKAFAPQNIGGSSRQEATQPIPSTAQQELMHKKQSVSGSKQFFDRRNQSNSMKHKGGLEGTGVLNGAKPGSRLKKDPNEMSHQNILSQINESINNISGRVSKKNMQSNRTTLNSRDNTSCQLRNYNSIKRGINNELKIVNSSGIQDHPLAVAVDGGEPVDQHNKLVNSIHYYDQKQQRRNKLQNNLNATQGKQNSINYGSENQKNSRLMNNQSKAVKRQQLQRSEFGSYSNKSKSRKQESTDIQGRALPRVEDDSASRGGDDQADELIGKSGKYNSNHLLHVNSKLVSQKNQSKVASQMPQIRQHKENLKIQEFKKLQASSDENETLHKEYQEKLQLLSEQTLLSIDIAAAQSPQIKKLMREQNKNIVSSSNSQAQGSLAGQLRSKQIKGEVFDPSNLVETLDNRLKQLQENKCPPIEMKNKKQMNHTTKKDYQGTGGDSSPNYFIYSEDELVDSPDISVDKEGGDEETESDMGNTSPQVDRSAPAKSQMGLKNAKGKTSKTTKSGTNYSMTIMGGINPQKGDHLERQRDLSIDKQNHSAQRNYDQKRESTSNLEQIPERNNMSSNQQKQRKQNPELKSSQTIKKIDYSQKKLTQNQISEFYHKKFQRETRGQLTLIFPFNQMSEDLSIELNKMATTGGTGSMNAPNHMKYLVQQIKQYYDEKEDYLTGKFNV